MRAKCLFLVLILVTSPGCLARQVARDGVHVRQALLDIYTDQVMDNLIRARSGLPFVQLTYSSILVQDVDSLSGNLQNTYTSSSDHTSNAIGAITGVVRRFSDALLISSTAKRDRTMSFKAEPVTDKNDIYEQYLAFAHNQAFLIASCNKPPCPVHVMKKCGKMYYWIPVEAAVDFQQLCLKTTFMRGPETAPPPTYWERIIEDVIEIERNVVQKKTFVFGAVKFNLEVKNADGSIIAVSGKEKRKIVLQASLLARQVKAKNGALLVKDVPAKGANTFWLEATWCEEDDGIRADDLRNQKIRVILPEYPSPPPAPPAVDLRGVNDNLDQIRLNILNLRNNQN